MRELGPALLALVVAGCGVVDGRFTAHEWERIESLSPAPEVPDDPSNSVADNEVAALLGWRLYCDPGLSPTGDIACTNCHDPQASYADASGEPTSFGVGWTPRNTPSVLNSAHYPWFMWNGRADSQWQAVTYAVEVSAAQNSTRLHVIRFIVDNYAEEYEAVWGPGSLDAVAGLPPAGSPDSKDDALVTLWNTLSPEQKTDANRVFSNFAKAVSAYLRKVVSGEAPFDRYVAGDRDAIADAAKRGLALFIGKAACLECHRGPMLTDGEFHNIGVAQLGEHVNPDDKGRSDGIDTYLANAFSSFKEEFSDGEIDPAYRSVVATADDEGAFRTPSLRDVARTGPYMHTGGLSTLDDVVRFYDWGGDPDYFPGTKHAVIEALDLTEIERADLVAFLETLTGEPPPESLACVGP